ncbi:hypothetical protein AGLY_015382 [Aphis glycines]|uniref:Uncharacterized protein n=1 Tax=Aphis glycines TaxID=307491 RepID=A0A6G0T135_APHGL|nr:hypothetical protein AGLY_015382 [Aphis glycines]
MPFICYFSTTEDPFLPIPPVSMTDKFDLAKTSDITNVKHKSANEQNKIRQRQKNFAKTSMMGILLIQNHSHDQIILLKVKKNHAVVKYYIKMIWTYSLSIILAGYQSDHIRLVSDKTTAVPNVSPTACYVMPWHDGSSWPCNSFGIIAIDILQQSTNCRSSSDKKKKTIEYDFFICKLLFYFTTNYFESILL